MASGRAFSDGTDPIESDSGALVRPCLELVGNY
jgi:hypothetical protein